MTLGDRAGAWRIALALVVALAPGTRAQPPAAPPAPPAPPQAEKGKEASPADAGKPRTVVFNFANAPWDIVLTRFAELADLSLAMETRPPGTFSFSDNVPRTIPEAIDLLNGVLLGKGYIVLRNDKFLALVPLDKPLPEDLIPRLAPDELAKPGKNEMVSVLIPLAHADPTKTYEEIKGLLSQHGSGVPLPQLKMLRLTDLAGTLREVVPLVQKIDEKGKPGAPEAPKQAPPKVDRIVALQSLTVAKVLPALKVVFGGAVEFAEGPSPDKLIVVATEPDQKRVADFLASLDAPVPEGEANTPRAYRLTNASGESVAEALQAIFPTERTRVRITGEKNSGVLLVDAPPSIQELIAKIVKDIEQQPMGIGLVEKVYRPKNRPASALATTLQSLYQGTNTRIASIEGGEALVLKATEEEQAKLASLLAQLDAVGEEGGGGGGLVDVVVPLKYATAATLATSLSSLFPPARTGCTFTSDAGNNLLIARCPQSLEARIKSLIERIDQPSGLGSNLEFLYQPKHAPVGGLVEMLQLLYPSATNVRALPRPGGGILISAPRQISDKVKESLELLDVADAPAGGAPGVEGDLKIFRLKNAKVDPLLATLRQLFPKGELDAVFIADAANNQLLVKADAKSQERIAKAIAELDINPAADTTVEIYSPKNVSAATLLEALKAIHGAEAGSRFSLDARGRGVLAVATPQTHERIRGTVAKVDIKPGPADAPRADELYKLKHAKASELAETLKRLFPPELSDVSISADAANNVLIISAPDELQKKIGTLIERVDVPSESRLIEKIYSPKNQSATALLTTIQSLYNRDGLSTFALANNGGSIVALAPQRVHQKIDELLKTLEQSADPGADLVQRVYKLRHASTGALAQTLQQVFPTTPTRATVAADTANNSLIVSAPAPIQEKIGQLIEAADSPSATALEEKVIQPKNVPVTAMANTLQALFSGQQGTRVSVDANGSSVIVLAPPGVQERIAGLAQSLDAPPDPAAQPERKLYPMKSGSAYYVYTTLTTLFPAGTTTGKFSYDANANVVIVIGPPSLQESVAGLIAEIDIDPRRDLVERTFVPRHASAAQLVPLMQQMLSGEPKTTITAGPNGDRVVVLAPTASQSRIEKLFEQLDVEPDPKAQMKQGVYPLKHAQAGQVYSSLTILMPASTTSARFTYDTSANTLIVYGSQEVQDRVKELLERMDVPAKGETVEKVYEVKNAPAPKVATLLRTALASTSGTTVTPTPDGQRILVVATPTVQERVTGLLEMLDQPPAPGEEKERQLYRLKYANASQLAASLQALYPATDFPALVTYDSTNNVVIADAPAALQAKIRELIAEVDRPAAGRTEKVYALQHRKADQLVTALTSLLANSSGSRVVVGPDQRSLIVIGTAQDQDHAAEFIKQFDQPTPDQEITRTLYRLRHSKARTLANSLQTLFANDPTARITYEEPNNAIVVLAKPEVHRQVRDMINDFDQERQGRPMVEQVFTLKYASAPALLNTLRQVFDDPEIAKFSADDVSGTLVARTLPDLADRVKEMVRTVDQPKQLAEREVEVVTLREVDPYSARSLVMGLFDQLRPQERPSVESVYDPPRLIIRALPEQMKEIRGVLAKMGEYLESAAAADSSPEAQGPGDRADAVDAEPKGMPKSSGTFSRTIRLAAGDPRTVGEAIEKLWPRLRRNPIFLVTAGQRAGDIEAPAPVPAEPKSAEGEPAPLKVEKVPADLPGNPNEPVFLTPGVNRIVVMTKDREALALVEQLVDSLTEIPDYDQGEFTIFYLRLANAADVAKAIDEAFNGRERGSGGSGSGGSGDGGSGRGRSSRRDRVRVVSDDTANALIVRASPVDMLNVQRLIESLDQEGLANANEKQPRIIPLKEASADEVLQVLQDIYKDYLQAGSGGPLNLPGFAASVSARGKTSAISVGVDARSNSLVVAAPEFLFKQIESLVESLQKAAADSGRSYRVLPLKYSNPLEVREALEILLNREPAPGSSGTSSGRGTRTTRPPRRSRRSSGSPSPASSSPSSGSSTRPSGSSAIQAIPTAGAEMADAQLAKSNTRTRVTTITSTGRGARVNDSRPKLLVPVLAVEPRAGADEESEGPLLQAAHFQPEVPEDGDSTPAELELGAFSGSVEVRALPDLGVILLLGNDKDLANLSAIVAEIERVSKDQGLTFQLFPLETAKAGPMADLLNDLYQRMVDARGAGTLAQSQAMIVPLAVPNALLLAAPKDDIEMLLGLARKFDVADAGSRPSRVFRLKFAKSSDIGQTITRFFANRARDGELAPEILVEPDDRSNTLLVHAAPGDMREVERLLADLDVETTNSVSTMRVFPLRFTVAQELARVLDNAIQGGRGSAGGAGTSGTTAGATTTGSSRGRGGPSLQLLTPDPENKRTVSSGILEDVRITPNERANTLVVSAPAMTMDLIEALITQLDVLPEAVAEVKVFTLENSDALTMVQTLRSLFTQLQAPGSQISVTAPGGAAGGATGNGAGAGALGTGGEPGSPLIDLTFSVDERTNSILASGSRPQLEVVEAIVIRLDGSDIEERQTDVYRLRNAGASDVAGALTSLLEQQTNLEQLQEGVSLQQQIEQEVIVVPELVSNSLLISSSPRFFMKLITLIEKLDEAPPQVVIQVLIAQVDLEKNDELGVELGVQDSILFDRSIFPGISRLIPPFAPLGVTADATQIPGIPGFNFNNQPLGNNPNVPGSSQVGTQGLGTFNMGRTNSNLGYGGFVFSASSENVSVLIRALAQRRRLEILSRPQIMTLDNQEAFIQVGQQVPLIANSVIQPQGGVVNTVQYQDVGIILQVVPKINPDGSVVMRVDPEISALAPITDANARVEVSTGVFARAINTTRAQTTVSANDGQTAVIGGLIRRETEVEERKVPLLGDVPVLGHLFRYDRETKTKRELLILLTPHVVRCAADAERIKQMEAERINWCLADIEKIHGDIGLPTEVFTTPVDSAGGAMGEEVIVTPSEPSVPNPPEPMELKPIDPPSSPPPTSGGSGAKASSAKKKGVLSRVSRKPAPGKGRTATKYESTPGPERLVAPAPVKAPGPLPPKVAARPEADGEDGPVIQPAAFQDTPAAPAPPKENAPKPKASNETKKLGLIQRLSPKNSPRYKNREWMWKD